MAEFKHHPTRCECYTRHASSMACSLYNEGRAEATREIVADLRSDCGEPQYFRDILANLADRYERGEDLPAKEEGE